MGTWGTGPFDRDSVGDFVDAVGACDSAAATALVHAALECVATGPGRHYGGEAVAAAALLAIQLPGGGAYTGNEDGLPALPAFPAELPGLAMDALEVVLHGGCDVSSGWVDPADEAQWRAGVIRIRSVPAAA
ncbi:DUF4259 domain-containing protein [Yinghuangia soli]|uniref:DUF4259 domain-containing protein n=1 Tax=Yinghuangia soli TaxID=2908204 RepID=A0AA41Q3Y8_9ACTN|nr:DUF4259 domain-containing protein [Yinghuangia soli]MCF2530782.1 DUF4259 domain-containing protein [Yinghuangia soli]